MNSFEMRRNPLFLRNSFESYGKYDIPLVKKQEILLSGVGLLSFSDTKTSDLECNTNKGVHFFIDDYRFEGVYNHPEKSLSRLSQYAFLLTPDFSTYAEMDLWRQIESVAKNRWCGAYWQSKGLKVIPTVSWSTSRSYDFCFDGIENGSVIAIGMIGCKRNKKGFLRGYEVMMNKIHPSAILCFGTPFPEMEGNIIPIDYLSSRKVVR